MLISLANSLSRYDELQNVQQRDDIKKSFCSEIGITLLAIPYWWSHTLEYAVHAIHDARPDILLPCTALPHNIILNQMPRFSLSNSVRYVPAYSVRI